MLNGQQSQCRYTHGFITYKVFVKQHSMTEERQAEQFEQACHSMSKAHEGIDLRLLLWGMGRHACSSGTMHTKLAPA